MGKYFGTDGFRGEANKQLTAKHAFLIGRFIGWYFGKEHRAKIVIGKDSRKSGDMLEYAVSAGITSSGADAYLMHLTTTPSVAYMARKNGFDCGVMISASHNPYYDNGIKLLSSEGRKISAEIEDMIETYIDEGKPDIPLAMRDQIGSVIDYSDGRDQYVSFLAGIPGCAFAGKKIGLDCANGSTSELAEMVFRNMGAELTVIHHEPDGVNINNGCGSTHIESLCQLVKEKGLDAGFAYDGDGDRCLAVDEKGQLVDGDLIMYICGKYMSENGKLKDNTIVTTVMSNIGLYKAIEREGMRSEQTAVGDKYVAENMFTNGYSIGGEQSGHIIFGDYSTTGDGILTSLMMMEVMTKKNASLSELAGEVTIFPQLLKNVRVKNKEEAKANPKMREAVEAVAEALGTEGRILVRESGTEPLIRVMVEGRTDEICEKYVNQVIDVILAENLAE